MATDTTTRPLLAHRIADRICELIAADAEDGLYPLDEDAPTTFSDLHTHTDGNMYLVDAAEACGFDLFSEGDDFPTGNLAIALVSERMAKPCDSCGEPLGVAAPRVTDEGTFHGLVCPADAHRVR